MALNMNRSSSIRSLRVSRLFLALVLLSVMAVTHISSVAASQPLPDPKDGQFREETYSGSLFGSYLAGRIATGARDLEAAARFFEEALRKDPESEILVRQAFLLETMRGNWSQALPLAEKTIAKESKSRKYGLAHMVLGVRDFAQGRFVKARDHFKKMGRDPFSHLAAIIGMAWAYQGEGKTREALRELLILTPLKWARNTQNFHHALIADVGGRKAEARRIYEKLFSAEKRTLRVALAYARHLAALGRRKAALRVIEQHLAETFGHSLAKDLKKRLQAGDEITPLATSAQEGLAELYYGLGEALVAEGGMEIGAIFLQLALYLRPDFPLALITLGENYENAKRYALANAVYERIPSSSPLWLSATIRRAYNLNALKKVEEATALLEKVIAAYPKALAPLEAMGSILRAHKRYGEAIPYFSKAIALIKKPQTRHWKYFYARGVTYERMKQWDKAEADLLMALRLKPDQPMVLNYLGYSWVDQGVHLKRAMALIQKAVDLRPNDGYLVDSLGWAYYRLGQYEKAVRELERAVKLTPEDPIINDHLADAYWRTGRELEARYLWAQVLTLDPEPDLVKKVKEKLKKGLPPPPVKKTAMTYRVQPGDSLWGIAKKYLGKGYLYHRLLKINDMREQDVLLPGQKILIPAK